MMEAGFRRRMIVLVALATLTTGCSAGAQTGSRQPSVPSATPLALSAGFPIGTWTTTISAEDLRAVDPTALAGIGMSEEDLVRENAGTFTTTFAADGTWTTVQKSDQLVKWPVFRGSFVPVGTSAMIQTTTFPPEFNGDAVEYTWRVENGLLYLAIPEPPDPVLAVVTAAHPWSPVR